MLAPLAPYCHLGGNHWTWFNFKFLGKYLDLQSHRRLRCYFNRLAGNVNDSWKSHCQFDRTLRRFSTNVSTVRIPALHRASDAATACIWNSKPWREHAFRIHSRQKPSVPRPEQMLPKFLPVSSIEVSMTSDRRHTRKLKPLSTAIIEWNTKLSQEVLDFRSFNKSFSMPHCNPHIIMSLNFWN